MRPSPPRSCSISVIKFGSEGTCEKKWRMFGRLFWNPKKDRGFSSTEYVTFRGIQKLIYLMTRSDVGKRVPDETFSTSKLCHFDDQVGIRRYMSEEMGYVWTLILEPKKRPGILFNRIRHVSGNSEMDLFDDSVGCRQEGS